MKHKVNEIKGKIVQEIGRCQKDTRKMGERVMNTTSDR